MTIWEKVVLNLQRGFQKIMVAAALFAERVNAEIVIVRLRIRIEETQKRMDELHRGIGRTLVDLNNRDELPRSTEKLLQNEDIAAAVHELADRQQEIADLNNDLKKERVSFKPAGRQPEDRTV